VVGGGGGGGGGGVVGGGGGFGWGGGGGEGGLRFGGWLGGLLGGGGGKWKKKTAHNFFGMLQRPQATARGGGPTPPGQNKQKGRKNHFWPGNGDV